MTDDNTSDYVLIPTAMVAYGRGVRFNVYIKTGDRFFLYARDGKLTDTLKQKLLNNYVSEIFIRTQDKEAYESYVESNMSDVLLDESIPLDERSKVLYTHATGISRQLFTASEASPPGDEQLKKIQELVECTHLFISRSKDAVRSVGKLISHNYKTYSHCVNVSLYSVMMMVRLGCDRLTTKAVGVGGFLHDIGKIRVPASILDKNGPLTPEERQVINQHPVSGLVLCQQMNLEKISMDCVVFHHEKLDGSGYPANARTIAPHVRVVTLADIYDALTAERPYSKALTPFEAMRIILKDVEAGRLDKEIYTEFIRILSSGDITL